MKHELFIKKLVLPDEGNFVDLVWHECEFRDGGSYTYAVYHAQHGYTGCCYLYPLGGRTTLTDELARDFDVDVSWWVTPPAYERGDYATLYTALQHWLAGHFAFWRPHYSNHELVALADSVSAPSSGNRPSPNRR
jgi:hypothetical protein